MACLGNRRGRGRGASLIGKESSHVCVACWLLGCGKVLAARQNGTARASHKRHTIEPVTRERLHCAEADIFCHEFVAAPFAFTVVSPNVKI